MKLIPYRRKIQFYETDQMRIVHHSNYIRWFEEARVDFMEQINYGYQQAVASGIDFAVLGISCEYNSMARFGETVRIDLWITELRQSRMTIAYRVSDDVSGEIRATGTSRHCYFHNKKGKPVSLKKELPALYLLFEKYADGTCSDCRESFRTSNTD